MLAMVKHELDVGKTTTGETAEIAVTGNPWVVGTSKDGPYADSSIDGSAKCIVYNLDRYPFNITEVRKALTFAVNIAVRSGVMSIQLLPCSIEHCHIPQRCT